MSRALSGSPPYRSHFMPVPQNFIPQPYLAPSNIPYFDQMHQHGMHANKVNPYEEGLKNSGWYPQHFNPNIQPYYQPGQQEFGVPIPLLGYPSNSGCSPNHYDHLMKDGSLSRDACGAHGEYSQIYCQSPSSQHITVPHNSPVHSTIHPVNQSDLLSGSPVFGKPASLARPKRCRAPTFPGANPPNLSFFEGSKKSDWSTYSSDSGSNSQVSGPKRGSHVPAASTGIRDNFHKANDNRRPIASYVNQNVRNFLDPARNMQQLYRGRYQGFRRQESHLSYYSNERSAPFARARKLHFARPSMIKPAIPKITWVERSQSIAKGVSGNGNFDCYPEPLSSVDSASLSPTSTIAGIVKSPSPLMTPDIVSPISELSSPESPKADKPSSSCAVNETHKSRFTFNPKAENFVLVQEVDLLQASEIDEYVGFYLNPKTTPFYPPTASAALFTYYCDPMAWQVPNVFVSKTRNLKSCGDDDFSCNNQPCPYPAENFPKEFFGKVPNNMNWKKPVPVVKEACTTSGTNIDSRDRLEVLDTAAETGAITIPDKCLGVGVVPREIESCLIPQTETQGVADVESTHDIGNKLLVKDINEVLFGEAAQNIAKNVEFFESAVQNIDKFPGYVDLQPAKKLLEAKVNAEQVDDILGSDSEDELLEDNVELVAKLPDYTVDTLVGVDRAPDVAADFVAADIDASELLKSLHGTEIAEILTQPLAIKVKPEHKKKAKPRAKSKKTKSIAKLRNRSDLNSESSIDTLPASLPEPKMELRLQTNLDTTPRVQSQVKPEIRAETGPQVERLLQIPVPNSEAETELKADDNPEAFKESPIIPGHKTNLKAEVKLHSQGVTPPNLSITNPLVKDTTVVKIFNYRDALLTKVANPQTSIAPSSKTVHPKIASQRAAVSKVIGQHGPARIDPLSDMGSRRKFFLHPIPTTATYDSVTQQLKGGILEDIYISGLSPHPSAWKGPRGESRASPNAPRDNSWYCHVSFYSQEGASKFWELVQSGKEHTGTYQSRYGGFDDQQPGVFVLDGMRVSVNWRHNDQRAVNTLTMKAVTEENATRCLLFTFNTEAASRSHIMTPFLGITKESEKGYELAFIRKVVADIESWGQADSNLQGIRLLDEVLGSKIENAQTPTISNFKSGLPPKYTKVLVSFIKLLTAAKMKKFFSGRSEYSQNGFCKIEYYKDECDEPIDSFKAIREAKFLATKERSGGCERQIASDPQARKHPARMASRKDVIEEKAVAETTVKVGFVQGNVAERRESVVEEKDTLGKTKIHNQLKEDKANDTRIGGCSTRQCALLD